MKQKLMVTGLIALSGLAGGAGTSLVLAQQGEFGTMKLAEHAQVVFLNKDPGTLPAPSIPKNWRLVSVGMEGRLWFQDPDGNVFMMNTNTHDNRLGVSPNIFQIPVR